MNYEISELVEKTNAYELAQKTTAGVALNDDEREIASQLDAWAREIGKTGHDKDHEIAAFITRQINDQLTEDYEDVLSQMLDIGSVGEFDAYEAYVDPKNTLKAVEAAKGGNVDRSFIDIAALQPVWKNRQVETDISFVDLRKNGWKSIARLTEYGVEALRNARMYDVFTALDNAIVSGGSNYITEASTSVSAASADALALYIFEHSTGSGNVIIGLSKYIQQLSKLAGFASNEMKQEVHLKGFLGMYDSVPMYAVSSAYTVANDGTSLLIPDKRVFGIAGKVGVLEQRGDMHTYEIEDADNERIHIKMADFMYGIAFNDAAATNAAKIVVA